MFQTLAYSWKQGAPEPAQLELRDVLLACDRDDHVVVENSAIGLNPVDWKVLAMNRLRDGQIPGVDGVGVIAWTGASVRHLRVGQRVAYHASLKENGSFARLTVVPARAVMPVPNGLSDVAAAAAPCPGLTASLALSKVPDVAGRDVLVSGAGGAVGSLLVQMLVARRARVFATAHPAHHAELLERGVVSCVDYRTATPASLPRKMFAIFDMVSAVNAAAIAPLLLFGGHLVTVQGRIEQPLSPPFATCYSLHEVALGAAHLHGTDQQWAELVRAGVDILGDIAVGRLVLPPISVGAFDQLREKLAELKSGDTGGAKFVIVLDNANEPKRLTASGEVRLIVRPSASMK